MKTALFDFELPESLIAEAPANPRDSARMLVVQEGELQDRIVRELPSFLRAGDIMVFNDTKVIPARLIGKRGLGKIEVLLHKQLPAPQGLVKADNAWKCFAKPAKRLKQGDRLDFSENFYAVVGDKHEDGQVTLYFNAVGREFYRLLEQYGHMPLPPYIERKRKASKRDNTSYQTIYAKHAGSVAAPTAGLHFTPELLAAIDAIGVKRVHVTLHVGGGTFLPVKTEDTADHIMHSEYAEISAEVAAQINATKAAGGRVIAVGTTSLRTLESAATGQGELQSFAAETSIFITPGYRFKLVDVLVTNFHLPCSTLFMLVSAFSGLEQMRQAYHHAIEQRYRFYSYGDTCLLHKHTGN
jgi:S-adenosylmethionine:tRNA ribosyltransferase-isomerase